MYKMGTQDELKMLETDAVGQEKDATKIGQQGGGWGRMTQKEGCTAEMMELGN